MCTEEVTAGCVHHADERSADLKYVGTTVGVLRGQPDHLGLRYFAIATHGPWQTAAWQNEFDILINTDNDAAPDFVTINTRLAETDMLVSATFDLETGENVDVQAINDAWLFDQQGNPVDKLDTALFDSDVMVLPVFIDALGISQGQAGIDYSVVAFSNQSSDPVDVIDGLSFNLVDPGIATSTGDGILYLDADGEELPITRNLDAYTDSGGLGILVVHYHNAVGSKAEVVPVSNQSAPTNVTLSLDPTSVEVGQEVTATVAVTNTESVVPTGDVTLRTADDTIVGSGSLGPAGTVEIAFTPTTAGTVALHAEYEGDLTYVPGESAPQNLTVTKAASTVTLLLDPTSVMAGGEVTATVTVDDTAGGIVPTGSVTVKTSIGTTLGSGALDGTGTAVITFKPKPAGTYTVHAEYAGDGDLRGRIVRPRRP